MLKENCRARTYDPSNQAQGPPQKRVNTLLPLQVKYFSRMYRGRTYPVNIGWQDSERGVAAKPVTLRLEVAGALVVPAQQVIRPADPDDTATFYVTPLSSGKVLYHLIEVHYQNAKVSEMPLKARVVNQRFTYFLLVLAFLVPWLLSKYCTTPIQKDKLGPKDSLVALIQEKLPDLGELNESFPAWLPLGDWLKKGTEFIGTCYGQLCTWCQRYPIPGYTAMSFLVLTLISSWWHSPKRKRQTSDPIELPDANTL